MENPLVGLFGGTFNPIHFGHLNLAIALKEKCHLSEVWFIPNHCSPFRQGEPLVSGEHRLKMAKLATQDIPGFKVLDLELRRPPPSYMIDTITQLQILHPDVNFSLLMSEDAYAHFSGWKAAEEIKKRVSILVGSRRSEHQKLPGVVKTAIMEISSTEIRNRLNQGSYCGHLLPLKVLDYIIENQLYSIP